MMVLRREEYGRCGEDIKARWMLAGDHDAG
jgi:hypothetical protein